MATIFCVVCGEPLGPEDRFCRFCGTKVLPGEETLFRDAALWNAGTVPLLDEGEFGMGAPLSASDRRGLSAGSPPCRAPRSWEDYDEATMVLTRALGNDVQAAALGPSVRVSLERRRTGELIELALPAVLGKGTAADCRLGGNTAISRRHARMSMGAAASEEPVVILEDLGSLNKTRLNGDVVPEGVRREVRDGDVLMLADEAFAVRIVSERPGSSGAALA